MSIKWFVLLLSCCFSEQTSIEKEFKGTQLFHGCGGKLADALSKACDGNYQSFFPNDEPEKTSELIADAEEVENTSELITGAKELEKEETNTYYPFRSKGHIHISQSPDHKSSTGLGVVDECCRQPCTYNILWSYCG